MPVLLVRVAHLITPDHAAPSVRFQYITFFPTMSGLRPCSPSRDPGACGDYPLVHLPLHRGSCLEFAICHSLEAAPKLWLLLSRCTIAITRRLTALQLIHIRRAITVNPSPAHLRTPYNEIVL